MREYFCRVSFRVMRHAHHLLSPCHTPSTALCLLYTSLDRRPLLLKNIIHYLPGYMLLCQLTLFFYFFVVGAITNLNNKEGEGNTTFGIQNQKFLNFCFHDAAITTILTSISFVDGGLGLPHRLPEHPRHVYPPHHCSIPGVCGHFPGPGPSHSTLLLSTAS